MLDAALFSRLLIGHAVADFALQSDWIAKAKNWNTNHNAALGCSWWWVLSAHAAIHAGAVWVITGSGRLAAFEFVAHWAIDALKNAKITGPTTDQWLHVACKAMWLVV